MEMEFWGAVIPPGMTLKVEVEEAEEFVHVTQVALAADAKPGRCALGIVVGDGDQHVLCTLDKGKCDQVGLDIVVDENFSLKNHGANPLHLTGLRQTTDGIDAAEEDDEIERLAAMRAMEDTDEEEQDTSSDDEDDDAKEDASEGDDSEEEEDDSEAEGSEGSESEGSDEADGVLGQLVEMFKSENGRDPSEAEMKQWAATLRDAAEANGRLGE